MADHEPINQASKRTVPKYHFVILRNGRFIIILSIIWDLCRKGLFIGDRRGFDWFTCSFAADMESKELAELDTSKKNQTIHDIIIHSICLSDYAAGSTCKCSFINIC